MKKLYTLFLSLAILLLAAGCNYLDITPSGKVIPSKITEYRALLTSAYAIKPSHKVLLSVRADETIPYNYDGWGSYDNYIDLATWNDNTSDPLAKTYPWRSMYKIIFYANSVIDGIMDAETDTREDTKEQIMGEALLLRAYTHFELLNLYARPYAAATAYTDKGIPLSMQIDIEQEFIPESVGKVYDQILADIEAGKGMLQVDKQPKNLRYRFSRLAAQAFEARVRLYRAEWAQALEAAESMLAGCELEDLNDPAAKSPSYYDSKESILAMETVINIDIVGDMYMLDNTMQKYDKENDMRVARYFKKSERDYLPNKYDGDKMKVTFRSAEIYLIAAEAAAHLDGQTTTAKNHLKQLIVNRLTPGYYTAKAAEIDGMSQQQLIAEIADERVRELVLEGHRWYDLRRTTRPMITKTYLDKAYDEHTAVLQQDDPRYTIRFPKEATENNPNLNN